MGLHLAHIHLTCDGYGAEHETYTSPEMICSGINARGRHQCLVACNRPFGVNLQFESVNRSLNVQLPYRAALFESPQRYGDIRGKLNRASAPVQ
jgi:hypothetical protein